MNKLITALILVALLLSGVAAVALTAQKTHTTVVVQFPHGCVLLDAAGHNLSNATTTFYGYVGAPGSNFTQNYSVEVLGNRTMSLTALTVNATAGLAATINGLGTLPIVLAPGSGTPFSVTFVVTAAATTQNSATVTIEATCV